MKNLVIIIVSNIFISAYAQSPILSVSDKGRNNINNAYYKDINNELDSFTGTWIYSDGTTSIKVILQKQVRRYSGKYYEDRIIGEYQYIKDGTELVNTLGRLEDGTVQVAFSRHEIKGNRILRDCRYIPDNDCTIGEVRLELAFFVPNAQGYYGEILLKNRIVNGQQALKGLLMFTPTNPSGAEGRVLPVPIFPWQQEYVFIKQ